MIGRWLQVQVTFLPYSEHEYVFIGSKECDLTDYVYGMWLMLQQNAPEDYVLATGTTISVRDFVEKCFKKVGREIEWEGEGLNEVGREKNSGIVRVKIAEKFFRPCEVDLLLGDPSKAERELGWTREYDTLDKILGDMFGF